MTQNKEVLANRYNNIILDELPVDVQLMPKASASQEWVLDE